MWLAIVAPTISRALPTPMGDMGAWCTPQGLSAHHPAPAGEPLSDMDKCGYCSLFSHTPMAAGSVPALPAGPVLPAQAPLLARVEQAYVRPALHVRPRGPPSASSG